MNPNTYNDHCVVCRTCSGQFADQVAFYAHWIWPDDKIGRSCMSYASMFNQGWEREERKQPRSGEVLKVWVCPEVDSVSKPLRAYKVVGDGSLSGAIPANPWGL